MTGTSSQLFMAFLLGSEEVRGRCDSRWPGLGGGVSHFYVLIWEHISVYLGSPCRSARIWKACLDCSTGAGACHGVCATASWDPETPWGCIGLSWHITGEIKPSTHQPSSYWLRDLTVFLPPTMRLRSLLLVSKSYPRDPSFSFISYLSHWLCSGKGPNRI